MDSDDEEFEELFGYDIDELEHTIDTGEGTEQEPNDLQTTGADATRLAKGKEKEDGGLGVTETITIRKRKAPTKLTEEMLLGPNGIPYIREHAPKKLKFRGKGHEISDLKRLLKFYQIWADNLYPKAKFQDAIELIDKLGSSRSMHNKREEWIQEEKMQQTDEDNKLVQKAREALKIDSKEYDAAGRLVLRIGNTSRIDIESRPDEVTEASTSRLERDTNENSLFFHDDDEDDELSDLDALLREAEKLRPAHITSAGDMPNEDEFDELDEMMREMEKHTGQQAVPPPNLRARGAMELGDDEFEEAMAAMREVEK
ncbi:chromosome segregation in meiosis- protein [Orbilia ellipsospora]|uniref:Chromosome segregation in meiosis protein n=1 Tax=Orbilia ellipsospora TaxID=2528407 RepID=A0AAV9XQS9_9PEZI